MRIVYNSTKEIPLETKGERLKREAVALAEELNRVTGKSNASRILEIELSGLAQMAV